MIEPREKAISDQVHLFCNGEKCTARLAVRDLHGTSLEPGYTQEPHPSYPPGSWWRRPGGGRYRGAARGRAVRKFLTNPQLGLRMAAGDALDQGLIEEVEGLTVGERECLPSTLVARRPNRVQLPEGTHVVVCDRCLARVRIAASPLHTA